MGTFVIAGSSSGVGAALALKLATQGHVVVGLVPNETEVTRMTHSGLIGLGAHPILCDVADSDQVAAAAEAVLELHQSGIDGLVNCAAIWAEGRIDRIRPAVTALAVQVNLIGAINLMHSFVPLVSKSGGGRVINIASQAAVNRNATRAVYGATKAGVLSLSNSLGVELAEDGIMVSCVLPRPIDTPFYERAGLERDTTGWLTAETVADAIIFLLQLPPDVFVPRFDITTRARAAG
jgi:uncharacterized protein